MLKGSKIHILVVDDDAKVRELIQTFFLLKSDYVTCVTAHDSQQAVLKMTNQEFDIILIDNLMPGRKGIEFALFLKKSMKYSRIPIILMSGSFHQSDVLAAIEGGFKDILVKPFTLKCLNEKISACLFKKY